MEIKAVEMVREIRDHHYEQTKDLSPEERDDFYRRKAELTMAKVRELERERQQEAEAKDTQSLR